MARILTRTDYGLIRATATALTAIADFGICESDRMTVNEHIQMVREIESFGYTLIAQSDGKHLVRDGE